MAPPIKAPPKFENPLPVRPETDDHRQSLAKLRESFETNHSGDMGLYYEADVQELKTNDMFAWRFLRHYKATTDEEVGEGDRRGVARSTSQYPDMVGGANDNKTNIFHRDPQMALSVTMIHDSFKWRKEQAVRDIQESDIKEELLKSGIMFDRSTDVNGCRVLYLNMPVHKKSLSLDTRKYLLFIQERLYFAALGSRVVVFLNMQGCGMTQLDMDFTKYLISIYKNYYPDSMAYLIAHEMPFMFKAAWKIIQTLIGAEAAKRVIFLGKKDVRDNYISASNLPKSIGGDDPWTYEYPVQS